MTNSKNNVMTNIAKRAVAKAALMATTVNVNSTCFFVIHQPKLPNGAKNFASSDPWIVLQNYPIRFVEILSKAA